MKRLLGLAINMSAHDGVSFNAEKVIKKFTKDVDGEQVTDWKAVNKALGSQANDALDTAVESAKTEAGATAVSTFLKDAGIKNVKTAEQMKSHMETLGDTSDLSEKVTALTAERDDFKSQLDAKTTEFDTLTESFNDVNGRMTGYENDKLLTSMGIGADKLEDAKILINAKFSGDDKSFEDAAKDFLADEKYSSYSTPEKATYNFGTKTPSGNGDAGQASAFAQNVKENQVTGGKNGLFGKQ